MWLWPVGQAELSVSNKAVFVRSLCPLWGFFAELAPLLPAGRQSCLHWGRRPGRARAVPCRGRNHALVCSQAAQGRDSTSMGTLLSLEGGPGRGRHTSSPSGVFSFEV